MDEQPPSRVVGVSGAGGLLGWHTRVFLQARTDYVVASLDRGTFADLAILDRQVTQCDTIIHFAGANRSADNDIMTVNIGLAEAIVAACRRTSMRPHIIFANSTHCERETAYGRSKARAASILESWAHFEGGRFTDMVLPHVFGEHGRPFYNSVVSTFCSQLANYQLPSIVQDSDLELVHAGDVAETVGRSIENPKIEDGHISRVRVHGKSLRVSEMLGRLRRMADLYQIGTIPDIRDPLDRDLFNTFRSYLFPERYPVLLKKIVDGRGWLFEAVKENNGGQVMLSSSEPGVVRGNHFHRRKFERFLIISGEAQIAVRRIGHDEIHTFRVSGETPAYVDMPTLHTHKLVNCGQGELITLFWADAIFDPRQPDTYQQDV